MNRFLLTLLLSLLIPAFSFSQSKKDLKRAFVNAEFYLLYNEYKEALPLFMEIYNTGRQDANIKHRIGYCYLNIPNQKDKAIPYLEESIQDITEEYRVGEYNEKQAPIEAYYYLGIAYRVNNEIEKAIAALNQYKELLDPADQEKNKLVETQLTACKNAIELSRKPTNILETNLGKNINNQYPNTHPVVSGDEETIVYTSELRFYSGVFMSKKRDGRWLPARNISLEFNSEYPVVPVFIARDGKTLYLQRNDQDIYNLYVSRYHQGVWSQPEKLNNNINTKANETHACVSDDGKTLYFTSNREGGFGGFDIYQSELDANGEWGPPKNLGATVNSYLDEVTPFITEDGSTLYFSSQGHFNIGGFDIFTTSKKGESWSKPQNLGYPFNTTDDDIFFFPLQNGKIAYYSKFKETGLGENDIYRIQIFEQEIIPEED
ncbi:MAG: hypothetical protein V2I54_04615 [Bacteroidales bacterium]|jgi:hypothetical protein|nr:hypothetical protein [Bacteroidales bacterium]